MQQDLRLSLRNIFRAPSYAAIVIASLAIGIAAPVLAFSILNAALFRPIDGVTDQDRLIRVGLTTERGERWFLGSTHALYEALRTELSPIASLGAAVPAQIAIAADRAEPRVVNAELVSANYFDTLQVRPAAGRLFRAADTTSPHQRIAVISHDVWQRQFQLAPDVVGRYLLVNSTPLQVVGVASEGFTGVNRDPSRVWLPFGLADLVLRREGRSVTLEHAGPQGFVYFGRLAPDADIAQVQAVATSVVARADDGARDRRRGTDALPQQRPGVDGAGPRGSVVTAFWQGRLAPGPLELAASIGLAMALPFLVLAIACVNAGNVVLARATRVAPAWTLQLALGASRVRLLRQPIMEGLLLAIPAAAGGLLLTRWGFMVLEDLIPFELAMDWRVVIFAFSTAIATPLVFGVGPMWNVLGRMRQAAPGQLMQTPGRTRTRTILLVAQGALSVALLGTGIQWVRTVLDGFGDGLGPGDRLIVASLDVDKLGLSREEADTYYETLLARVRTVPGAQRAALLGGIPNLTRGVGREGQTSFWRPTDRLDNPPGALIAYVTPNFFSALGLPLTSGRDFSPAEYSGPLQQVIVNEPFVRRYLTGVPIGQTMRLRPRDQREPVNWYAAGHDVAIIGVVRGGTGRRNDAQPTVFASVADVHLPARTLYVPFGDAGGLMAAMPALRDAIRATDPRVPYTLARLDDERWRRSEPRRFMAIAVVLMGALALILAAVGLYGAVSYAVERRTREIGVRMAVGATAAVVLLSILGDTMRTAALACAIGIGGAVAGAAIGRSSLYGTSAIDPAAYAATIGILLVTMLLAGLVPAARAARIDPVRALRAD